MKNVVALALCACSLGARAETLPFTVGSPDARITLRLAQNDAGQLTYQIERYGATIFPPSALRLRLAEGDVSSVDVRQVEARNERQVVNLVATKASGSHEVFFKEVTVTGEGGDEAPTADASVTAKDYSFTMEGLKAGEQTVAFVNDGPKQWHFGDIEVFPAGTTVAEATEAVNKLITSNGPPPAGVPQPDTVATLQIASPGLGNTLPVTLLSGRTYVILCFVSDLAGGPPHAIGHQMFKVFTVD